MEVTTSETLFSKKWFSLNSKTTIIKPWVDDSPSGGYSIISFIKSPVFWLSVIIGLEIIVSTSPLLATFKMIFFQTPGFWLSTLVVFSTTLLCLQGIFTLMWMLYAWENPTNVEKHSSPTIFLPPQLSFSALLAARHEEKVIADTIMAISNISYPEHLKELLVLCRTDDVETIAEVKKTISSLGKENIRLLVFDDLPINKPHSLNIGLQNSSKQIITVFDAEDQPHSDIYSIVNTLMCTESVDVVQSGVQLMNFRSHWFSSINVLEYYFWFKSGLHFFSKVGNVTPLGGNTVFIKKERLQRIGGWDDACLTEDADLGIRLVKDGAKVRIVYDEKHVTREETPGSVGVFVKQRTRWNHGFLQVLAKGDWKELPQLKQRFVTLYTLIAPILQVVFLIYMPISLIVAFQTKLPILVTMLSFVPTYVFLLQITIYCMGIWDFAKKYHLKYTLWDSFKILLVFFPYQLILSYSSIRAVFHFLKKNTYWEKTSHTNAHRLLPENIFPAPAYAQEYL